MSVENDEFVCYERIVRYMRNKQYEMNCCDGDTKSNCVYKVTPRATMDELLLHDLCYRWSAARRRKCARWEQKRVAVSDCKTFKWGIC